MRRRRARVSVFLSLWRARIYFNWIHQNALKRITVLCGPCGNLFVFASLTRAATKSQSAQGSKKFRLALKSTDELLILGLALFVLEILANLQTLTA